MASPALQHSCVSIKGIVGSLVLLRVIVALVPVHVLPDTDADQDQQEEDEGQGDAKHL